MRSWLFLATGISVLATGCGRTPPPDDPLAFVPEDALLFASLESIESFTEEFEELGDFLPPSRHRRSGLGLQSTLAKAAGLLDPKAIDPDAPVGLVLLEQDAGAVPVWLLPLKAEGAAPATLSGGPIAIHGRTAVLSTSEAALRRCEPHGASSKLAPALKGALHVVVDARRLVDRYRNAIDSGLRKWEQLMIELPQTVSAGSKVPPPPTSKVAEAMSRGARHAIFGTERAELALDLREGRLRLEAEARVREGSRAEAALARLPASPILLDRLPESGDMLLQFSTSRGPAPELAAPMFDWMVDGLAEPSRSELRAVSERMGSFPGVAVGAARLAPEGVDLLSLFQCEDPEGAFRAGQEYFDKLASLSGFFRNAEEAPFRLEVGEPTRWEHSGHAVVERPFVQEARDEDSPAAKFLRMWTGENSRVCAAVVGDLFVTAIGPRSPNSMRRSLDHLSAGGRTAPPPRVREWLSRVPPEVSILFAVDLAVFFRSPFLPQPLPFPRPDRPVWLFFDFTGRGREARAGFELDLGGMLEVTRPR